MPVSIALTDDLETFLPTRLLAGEEALLLHLQTLFPSEQTREYKTLCQKSDAQTLTETERVRLLELIEKRDHQNAERLQIVAQIAQMREVSLQEAMKSLGIKPE